MINKFKTVYIYLKKEGQNKKICRAEMFAATLFIEACSKIKQIICKFCSLKL